MKCKGLFAELADYLDEMLDPALRVEIEEHLAKCKRCRIVVDTCKKTIDIYCNAEAVPLPEDTRSRLHSALREKLSHQRRA